MKFNIYNLLFLVSFLLWECKNNEVHHVNEKHSEKNGGTFTIAENIEVNTIFPPAITTQVEGLIASQIHEGLVRLDPKTLEIVPGIAENWEISIDGKLITFHLNKSVYFQDDKCYKDGKGPQITTKDIKYTLEQLCTNTENNLAYETVLKDRLVGANEFYNKKTNVLEGLKIIDDYTFCLELVNPNLSFISLLANPSASILNEKALTTYGKNLKTGAGPFKYSPASTNEKFILVRNPSYHGVDSMGNALPYLDTVIVYILPSIEDGLMMYENRKVDLVNTLPSLRIKDVVEKNIQEFMGNPPKSLLQREPEMISQFYVFNTKQPPFDNVKVRQAINYAVDREKLVDNVLQGQAIGAAIYGITPNTFNGYNIKSIKGYNLDIRKAKQLLSEAGYPGGIGFPEARILISSGNSRNSSVAVELQKQLKDNLNINTSFESLPNNKKHELEMYGKSDIFRSGWVADYPSPESFLTLFIGNGVPADFKKRSFPNTSRYQNPAYDELLTKGREAIRKDSSYAYFLKAEQMLINDAVIIPLWYEGSYRLLSNKVKGLNLNAMRYYDLTRTYKTK